MKQNEQLLGKSSDVRTRYFSVSIVFENISRQRPPETIFELRAPPDVESL